MVLALLSAVLLVDLIGFGWALPHTVAPHPDDTAKPAIEAMQERFLGQTKYGKVHLLTLASCYVPYFGWLVAQGDLDLDSVRSDGSNAHAFADPIASTNMLLCIARAVSVALHLGTVLFIYGIVWRLTRQRGAATLAAACWGFSPMVTFFARASNVDVPMCFWASAAGFVGVGVIQAPGRRGMLAFCALCILAVCTKEQIAFALAPVCLLVGLVTLVRHPGGLRSAIGDLAWGLAIGALVYALLTDLLWNPSLYQERLSTWQGNIARFEEKTSANFTTMNLLREGCLAFVHVVGPGVAALAVLALLLAALRLDLVGLFLGLCCVGYGAAITVYLGYVQPRFLFPSALFAALLVGRGFAVLFARPKTGFRTVCVSFVKIAFLVSVAHSLLIAWALVVEPRGAALKWIAEHVIVIDKEDPQFVGGHIEGSSNFNFLAYEAEVYQNENLLPGVRALGLGLHYEEDMTQEGFLERKPPLVVVADNFRWTWNDEQNKFVTWLFEGPPEYRVVQFGPEAMGYRSDFMHGGPRARIWPNVVVLVLDP